MRKEKGERKGEKGNKKNVAMYIGERIEKLK